MKKLHYLIPVLFALLFAVDGNASSKMEKKDFWPTCLRMCDEKTCLVPARLKDCRKWCRGATAKNKDPEVRKAADARRRCFAAKKIARRATTAIPTVQPLLIKLVPVDLPPEQRKDLTRDSLRRLITLVSKIKEVLAAIKLVAAERVAPEPLSPKIDAAIRRAEAALQKLSRGVDSKPQDLKEHENQAVLVNKAISELMLLIKTEEGKRALNQAKANVATSLKNLNAIAATAGKEE